MIKRILFPAVCSLVLASCSFAEVVEAPRYNVVIMMSDDHGREALGSYGNPVVQTPNLDRLAESGLRFTNAFCTSASCAASRSTILTGLHNHANGTFGHTHSYHHFSSYDTVRSLPAMLSEAGYRTGRVGKKHYAPESVYPFDFGVDQREFDRDDVAASESCREFIAEEGPFFLYWCSFNPHRDERTVNTHPHRPNTFGNPDNAFAGDTEQTFSEDEVIVPSFLSDTPEVRAELAQYYQSIARLDRGIGRLIDVLKEEGKYDSTLIIYMADNGAAFPGSKTTLYDAGMRLPFIVKMPESASGGEVVDELVSWVDITPTLLDFAGATPADAEFQGESFLPLLERSADYEGRSEIFASHTFHEITNYYPMRVIRTKKYKFIWNVAYQIPYPFASDLWDSASWQAVRRDNSEYFGARKVADYLQRPQFELYDVENDPDEVVNLASHPEYSEMVKAYSAQLKEFQKETKDPWVLKWEYD
ncbi:sulfatase [Coraliomargarita sp. SDUM461003]|uniref:Sulfatase n=1 Tax=Thalassobacterium maritimum TaxID=3041265 RepID=A0ABU1ATS4_9BACT|nr:sulfatase [Coraliomargarita sp. SDUM461003]MDQ8206377.1 sulfatase [Coraliomargarita sp. SDUM461003]